MYIPILTISSTVKSLKYSQFIKNIIHKIFTLNVKSDKIRANIHIRRHGIMLSVLIAEDNVPVSIHLANSINTQKCMKCIGILNEGTKVYQRIKELDPDILILDLKMPGKDGLQVLEEIQTDKSVKTKVIVYSGEMDYMALIRKFECVERLFSKVTPSQEIVKELERMVDSLSNRKTQDRIFDILFKIGFTYSLKGTRLMNDCILYSIVEDEDNIKNIYAEVARQRNQNVNTLKSDIDTAIKNMWRFADRSKIRRILRIGEHDKPSSKGIISMVKYYINS